MTNLEIAVNYYNKIINHEIIANQAMHKVAQRFINDLKKQNTEEFPFIMDTTIEADKVINLAGKCRQTTDKWAGKCIVLQDWQIAWFVNLYGWRHVEDKSLRRFKEAYLQVSRKAGKSAILAIVLLHDLLQTPQAQGMCVALTREQAHCVYDQLCGYVTGNTKLNQILEIKTSTNRIIYVKNFSYVKTVAVKGNLENLNGANPSCAVIDEIGSFQSKREYNAIKSGQGARSNPLLICIGSATTLLNGAGNQQRIYSEKMLNGLEPMDEEFFPTVYSLDDNDDWKDSKNYIKAQPNLNYTVPLSFYEKYLQTALINPSEEEEFKTKLLGLYVHAVKAFIPMKDWSEVRANAEDHKLDMSRPFHAVGAIDLSKRDDLTVFSIAAYQDDYYYMMHKIYFPENQFANKVKRDSEYWGVWKDRGLVTMAGKNVIDYAFLVKDVLELCQLYKVEEVMIDPYNMSAVENELDDLTLVPVAQHIKQLSPMTKDWQQLILEHKIVDDNPVMAYMVSNCEVYTDPNGNIKLQKQDRISGETKRIDGCITSLMACGRIKQLLSANEIDLRTEEEKDEAFKALLSINIFE